MRPENRGHNTHLLKLHKLGSGLTSGCLAGEVCKRFAMIITVLAAWGYIDFLFNYYSRMKVFVIVLLTYSLNITILPEL